MVHIFTRFLSLRFFLLYLLGLFMKFSFMDFQDRTVNIVGECAVLASEAVFRTVILSGNVT